MVMVLFFTVLLLRLHLVCVDQKEKIVHMKINLVQFHRSRVWLDENLSQQQTDVFPLVIHVWLFNYFHVESFPVPKVKWKSKNFWTV